MNAMSSTDQQQGGPSVASDLTEENELSIDENGPPSSSLKKDLGPDDSHVALKRELGLFSAVSLIVSVMIGSGIFISSSSVLEKSGSVGLCLIVWGVCGVISYFGALVFAELGTVVPESGAEYAYFQAAYSPLNRFLGPLPAFIYVWVMLLIVKPAEVAILLLTFAEYFFDPIIDALYGCKVHEAYGDISKKLTALLILGIITYINVKSVKLYVKIQNLFSLLKVLSCLIVIGGGIYELSIGNTKNLRAGFAGTKTSIKDLVLAFYSGLWAFDGWSSVTVVTEEIKRPEVNIPRSISIGVPLVTVLYFMMNVSYLSVLTVQEIVDSPAVAVKWSEKLLGPVAFIIPVSVCLATFGTALSIQFGVSRICYVAGRHNQMVQSFSFIHVRSFTPSPAVVIQCILSCIFIANGNIVKLIDMVSFLIWLFYGLACVSLFILRKTKKNAPRPYKAPFFIPLLIGVVAFFLALVPLVISPEILYLVSVGFILIGVVVYHFFVYKKKSLRCMGAFTKFIQLLFEVAPPGRASS